MLCSSSFLRYFCLVIFLSLSLLFVCIFIIFLYVNTFYLLQYRLRETMKSDKGKIRCPLNVIVCDSVRSSHFFLYCSSFFVLLSSFFVILFIAIIVFVGHTKPWAKTMLKKKMVEYKKFLSKKIILGFWFAWVVVSVSISILWHRKFTVNNVSSQVSRVFN